MEYEEYKKKVVAYNPKADLRLIRKAFIFSKVAHEGQTRVSGEHYFSHPLGVAVILTEMKADSATICAALLHDVVEDTKISLKQVHEVFGEEIANLVEGVTKFEKIFNSSEEYKAENLRKVLIATAKDIRVMLLKLADRLHNMQTLKSIPAEKQRRIAKETMEIYAPIAHKLGMWNVKGQLEDLSLRYLDPKTYKMLTSKISEKREEREKKTKDIIKQIQKMLKDKGIKATVQGRAKYFYSIYKKMKKEGKGFNEIYDLIAIRIITKTIPECYAALGIIHDLWKPVPKRFKDYISLPKANGYQSLHTTVVTKYGKVLEVQIRTEDMHHIAEDGIAAHWRYKGTERDKRFDKKISWLKQMLEWKRTNKDAEDFVETLKIDLFRNEIVVFTPKGDPISLPTNATPVDFAFEVHSGVGEKCSKAKVNNRIVPLDYELKSGDIVEIITQRNAKPSRHWLKFAKTSKARSKIRSVLGIEQDPESSRRKHESKRDLGPQARILDQIVVKGKEAPIRLSRSCPPKLHDEIVGYRTKDKKIVVYRVKDCDKLKTLKASSKVELEWKTGEAMYHVRIIFDDQVGMLARILTEIAHAGLNISNVTTKPIKEKTQCTLKIQSDDIMHIEDLIETLRKDKGVSEVKLLRK